ncbi:MAG TPA: hypothetical protein VN813_02030 [Luteibacter sp.]|nr:hypothetical protein [Luteibacter sp.]
MQPMKCLATATLMLAIATSALAADLTRPSADKRQAGLYTVVNATFDSITGVALANANTDTFEDVVLGESLPGGLNTATVRLPPGECLRDIRVTFRDGRSQVFPAIDVCRSHTLRLGT